MKTTHVCAALVFAAALAAPALGFGQSAGRYSSQEAFRAHSARPAEVVEVRPAEIVNEQSFNAGSAIGAAVGYGVAHQAGGNYGNASRLAASALGGWAGTAAHRAITTRPAMELVVRDLDRGEYVFIVQDFDPRVRPGARVWLAGSGNHIRVVSIQGDQRPVFHR